MSVRQIFVSLFGMFCVRFLISDKSAEEIVVFLGMYLMPHGVYDK